MTADWLVQEFVRRAVPFVRVNSEDFPQRCRIAWTGQGASLSCTDFHLDASDVSAVWWRRSVAPVLDRGDRTSAEHLWAFGEAEAVWNGFWRSVDAHWVNRPDANAAADYKMLQLRAAATIGLTVPDTVVTNDPSVARRFVDYHQDVVCKAASSGLIGDEYVGDGGVFFTQVLSAVARDRLSGIGPEPYLLQEAVPKRFDVRVTVIGNDVFGCRIDSQQAAGAQTDWRAGDLADLPHEPMGPPRSVSDRCLKLTRRFGLRFAAIDFAVNDDGEWVFFELNPNGQWAWIEQLTGQPLAAALAEELTGTA